MSDILSEYVEGVRALIASVWPDTGNNGVFMDLEIEDIPFGDTLKPYAAFRSSLNESGEWGSDSQSFEDELEIWRFQPNAQEGYDGSFDGAPIRAKLKELSDALWAADYVGGAQVITVKAPNWNANLPANQYFKSTERPFLGGVLVVQMLVGEVLE